MLLLTLLTACGPASLEPSALPDPGRPTVDSGHLPESVAPADDACPDPGCTVFQEDLVHEYALTIREEGWSSLLRDYQTYVPATFSDGRASLEVGVRIKGYTSLRPITGKPSLRVSFDRYVDGQRYGQLEAVDLVNSIVDAAVMTEHLAYGFFRDGGQPASRTGWAHLSINEMDYGLYELVEKKDDVLIGLNWSDAGGSLYESSTEFWPCDFDDGGDPPCDCFEVDEVGEGDTRADLEGFCSAMTRSSPEAWWETMQARTDVDRVLRHVAYEIALAAYDHYAGMMGNFYTYHEPATDHWTLIPASMDRLFGTVYGSAPSCGQTRYQLSDFASGHLAGRCMAYEPCAIRLYERMASAAEDLRSGAIVARLDAALPLLQPYVEADPRREYTPDQFVAQVECVRGWLERRPDELLDMIPER